MISLHITLFRHPSTSLLTVTIFTTFNSHIPTVITTSSMQIPSHTAQLPHLPVLLPNILTEHYFVCTAQVKQTTSTVRSVLNPEIT
jgi:hypothetical protein